MIHRLDDKNIYVGNREITKVLLGDKELYNTVPVDLTRHVGDPEYVIDFTGGTIDYISKEGYSLDAFMTTPTEKPELTNEGLYFYEGRKLQSYERHSPTSGMFEVTVSIDEGDYGGSLKAIMAISDDYYSNRKRAIGYRRNSIVFFSSYSTTKIQSGNIESNDITIAFEWSIDSSSNNVLFVNGERIGNYYISKESNINSILYIGSSDRGNDGGTFILKNIKHYSTANKLTDEQVMESYLLQKN